MRVEASRRTVDDDAADLVCLGLCEGESLPEPPASGDGPTGTGTRTPVELAREPAAG